MPLRLDVGSALKHYRILSLLGRGGMGEVYAAEDTRLGRKVAIKCLPPRMAEDADRLRRFTQEAKAASSLNHPSILTIHDVDNVEGQPFLVTELIDGETLRERLRRGAPTLREALDIASQIASALAAAHAAGLVHRDVKPENVMVREDGLVKLLDFGLVKIATDASPNDETLAVGPDTVPGIVMGTTQYMSPEQARGLKVDARSDVFSLGVMLYEMVAGQPPFRGDTHSDLIAAILHFEPAPIADAPPDLDRLLSKALDKDRDERYQTAKDLAVDLRRMRKRLDASNDAARVSPGTAGAAWSSTPSAGAPSAVATPSSLVATPPGAVLGGRRRSLLLWVALAVAGVVVVTALVVVLLGVGGIGAWLKGVRPPATASFDNMVVEKLAGLGQVASVAMSGDGRFLAYVRNEGTLATIWVRQMATGSVVRVTDPTDRALSQLQLTPDGEHLYYHEGTRVRPFQAALMAIPTFGGKPRTVLEGLWDRPSFAPDGKRFVTVQSTETDTRLMMANADGSQATVMATLATPAGAFNSAAWSPSGRQVAVVTMSRSSSGATAGIRVIPVEGGEGRPVTPTGMTPWQVRDLSWTPDETSLLARVSTSPDAAVQLVRIRVADGHTERITRDTNSYRQLAFSTASGVIASVQWETLGSIWIGPADRLEEAREVPSRLSDNDGLRGLDWLDDTRLVFTRVHDVSNLWTIDDTGANARQLTAGFSATSPLTSPDGKFVLFAGDRDSPGVLRSFRLDLTGGRIVPLLEKMRVAHPSLSSDGRTLYFHDGTKVFKTPLAGGPLTTVFESPNVSHTAASPDGKWIAVRSTRSGGPRELVLIPAAGGAPRVIYTSLAPDISFRWYPRSEALLLLAGGAGRSTIFRVDLAGGAPRQLAQFTRARVVSPVLSPDGRRIAFYRGSEENSIVLLKPGGRQ